MTLQKWSISGSQGTLRYADELASRVVNACGQSGSIPALINAVCFLILTIRNMWVMAIFCW
jgi:hypothetical protein